MERITNWNISYGFDSDHSSTDLAFLPHQNTRGKLNCSLLYDLEYVKNVEKIIHDTADSNPCLLWDTVKCVVRGESIRSASQKNRKMNEEITRQIWGIWKLRLAYSPETPNLGQNQWCFVPCDLEIWRMILENNRASLLCCFKLCATFQSGNAHFGSNSTIFRAVWPWNLTDDLEKQ